MTKLQLNIISKIIFIIMLVPLYTCAALQDGKQSEKNNLIHVIFHLPPDTKISVSSSQTWIISKTSKEEPSYREKTTMQTDQLVPLVPDDDYTEIVVSSHAKTLIEFENMQVVIQDSVPAKSKKNIFHFLPNDLKKTDSTIRLFSHPELKNLPKSYICSQFGRNGNLQNGLFLILKIYQLLKGEPGYLSGHGNKITVSFSESGKTYILPEDFHENDKAAFYPLAPNRFLAVTPTEAYLLLEHFQGAEDGSGYLTPKKIPCLEESAAILDQNKEGYCLETSSIVLYDKDNFPQTYYYDQTEVDICKLPPPKKLPLSRLWTRDEQEHTGREKHTNRFNRQTRSAATNTFTPEEEASIALKQQGIVASTSEAQSTPAYVVLTATDEPNDTVYVELTCSDEDAGRYQQGNAASSKFNMWD